MVKILRIASYALTAAAAVALIVLVVFGTRGNAEFEAFLEKEGVVERLKAQSQDTPETDDALSPLVNQARAFALRIDPPPPPPPRREAPPRTETAREQRRPEPERAPSPPTPPRVTARYELVATAHYPDRPEQSLALLKPTTGSTKWHRQGERVGHLEIHEIRQGSVVLYQDGALNAELFVPAPPRQHKPLLKSDAAAAAAAPAGRPSHVDTHDSAAPAMAAAAASSPTRPTDTPTPEPEGPTFETGMSRAMQTRRQPSRVTPSPAATQRAVATRTAAAPRTPTPQEQQESLQQSISSIQEIMGATAGHTTPEEQKKEQEMWMQLLQILQNDKQSLEAAPTKESPPADEKAAEND